MAQHTPLNGSGSLHVDVTGTGEHTTLASIMRLVGQAQTSRSRAQALADRAAFILTLVAIGAGAATLLTWLALRRDDPAFKKVVDGAVRNLYKSGGINAIYEKWFLKPIPPKGVNLNVPMSAPFKKVVANPTDSGDPKVYQ